MAAKDYFNSRYNGYGMTPNHSQVGYSEGKTLEKQQKQWRGEHKDVLFSGHPSKGQGPF